MQACLHVSTVTPAGTLMQSQRGSSTKWRPLHSLGTRFQKVGLLASALVHADEGVHSMHRHLARSALLAQLLAQLRAGYP
jgi:hypothetical protein